MIKEIKDYLHLYLGSNYITTYKYKTRYTRKVLPRLTNGSYYNVVSLLRSPQYYDVKIVLRPLSDISMQEVWDCTTEMFTEQFASTDKVEFLKMFYDKGDSDYRCGFTAYVSAINWFRKNGFDVDGLIESGLAIDKTTLQ